MRQIDLRQYRLALPEGERGQREQSGADEEPKHSGQCTLAQSANGRTAGLKPSVIGTPLVNLPDTKTGHVRSALASHPGEPFVAEVLPVPARADGLEDDLV